MSDKKFDEYEFFKENYFFEIARKDQLVKAKSTPFGLLVLLGSALVFIIKNLSVPINLYELLLVIISLFIIIFSVYYFIKSFYGYEYKFIASSEELKNYHNDLVNYDSKMADNNFLNFVTDEYSKYADINASNNDEKYRYIHKANSSLIILFIFIILSGIPYLSKSMKSNKQVYDINITNLNNAIIEKDVAILNQLRKVIESNTETVKRLNLLIDSKEANTSLHYKG